MLLDGMVFTGEKFSVHSDTKMLVAYASDLGLHAGALPFARIYDDACDAGISIVSHKTGVKLTYYVDQHEDRNADGEITGWRYTLTPEHARSHPNMREWKVLIIND
jgi:hypothetical protein